MELAHLIQLSKKADRLIQFDEDDDRKQGHFLRNTAVAGGVGTAGLYGYGRQAISKHGAGEGGWQGVGSELKNAPSLVSVGAQRAMANAPMVGKQIASIGERARLDQALGGRALNGGPSKFGSIWQGIKGAASEIKKTHLSSRRARLVQLSAKLDKVIQFGK